MPKIAKLPSFRSAGVAALLCEQAKWQVVSNYRHALRHVVNKA